jgi:hypothetical protein
MSWWGGGTAAAVASGIDSQKRRADRTSRRTDIQ